MNVYAIQNSAIWRGIRGILGMPPLSDPGMELNLSNVQGVIDVSQGGFAKLDSIFFASGNNSINAAAYAGIVETDATLTVVGAEAGNIDNQLVRKLSSLTIRLLGGTVSPIRVQVSASGGGASFAYTYADVANPGAWTLDLPRLLPPSFNLRIDAAAGGAGDTINFTGHYLAGEQGRRIPSL